MTVTRRIPLGPDYHAEPGETKGHQHDVYTTKGELRGRPRVHVGTLMKSAVEDLAQMECRFRAAAVAIIEGLIPIDEPHHIGPGWGHYKQALRDAAQAVRLAPLPSKDQRR